MLYNSILMHQQLKNTLDELVAIPSVSSDMHACQAAITYIKNQFAPLGLTIEEHINQERPWIIISTQPTKEPDILLAAHVDVVPAEDAMFTVREEGDKLIGRGVFDMKFAAACYIELAKEHHATLKNLNIAFYFTTDEEIGGDSVVDFLARGWRPKCVLLPDGAENWHVESRAKGLYGIRLDATGASAHGSRPWEGDNALHRVMDICQTLRQRFSNDEPAGATLSITGITGGKAVNQIPDFASALIDFRSYDKKELRAFMTTLEALATQHGVTIHVPQRGDSVIFHRDHPSVQSFLEAFATITKQPVRYIDSIGGTDARHFATHTIPCIITSPRGGNRHGNGEWLQVDDLLAFYTLIEHWIIPPHSR